MGTLTGLYVYPIKSLGGIALAEAQLEARGLQYDRRWMLVDDAGKFLSQREQPGLALLGTALEPPFLSVFLKKNPAGRLKIPLEPQLEEMRETAVQVWGDHCLARLHHPAVNEWFSNVLGVSLRLVFMPDDTRRLADERYAPGRTPVSFADGFPYLLIGQASLDDLNSRLSQPLPMNRFRPNFVFTGGAPYEEDGWRDFKIGNVLFRGVKPCARCIIPTIDQDTAVRTAEPLKTLTTYRRAGQKVLFGQNVVWLGQDVGQIVRVGDMVLPGKKGAAGPC
ncbi:MAG: MOSC domain-containing protein [Saprospirales bacterium]|nr:MOSC domain-containing protein [Saprospirales bacterium]MBK8920401.1 MOSC domain-containing protein [Saprospirales bacterium]